MIHPCPLITLMFVLVATGFCSGAYATCVEKEHEKLGKKCSECIKAWQGTITSCEDLGFDCTCISADSELRTPVIKIEEPVDPQLQLKHTIAWASDMNVKDRNKEAEEEACHHFDKNHLSFNWTSCLRYTERCPRYSSTHLPSWCHKTIERSAFLVALDQPHYLRMTIILTASLRAVKTRARIIWMLSGNLARKWNILLAEDDFLRERIKCLKPDIRMMHAYETENHELSKYITRFKPLSFYKGDSRVEKVIVLDADMIVTKTIDELFCLPEGSFTVGMQTAYQGAVTIMTTGKLRYLKFKMIAKEWSNVKRARKYLNLAGAADEFAYWELVRYPALHNQLKPSHVPFSPMLP